MIKQAKFTFSSLGKTFEKWIKTIEDQRDQPWKTLNAANKELSIKDFIPKNKLNLEIVNEFKRISELKKKVNRHKMLHK